MAEARVEEEWGVSNHEEEVSEAEGVHSRAKGAMAGKHGEELRKEDLREAKDEERVLGQGGPASTANIPEKGERETFGPTR